MAPDERKMVGSRRRTLFKAWIGFAIIGGLFIMVGGPFAERFWGHGVVAFIDLAVVFFLTATGIAWLVWLAMSKRRGANPAPRRDHHHQSHGGAPGR